MQTKHEMEVELVKLNTQLVNLFTNPQYQEFLIAQKNIEKQIKELKEELKHAMVQNEINDIELYHNEQKITAKISYANKLEVEDISKVPSEFLTQSVDMEKIKQYQLLGIETSGIKNNKIPRLSIKIDGKII